MFRVIRGGTLVSEFNNGPDAVEYFREQVETATKGDYELGGIAVTKAEDDHITAASAWLIRDGAADESFTIAINGGGQTFCPGCGGYHEPDDAAPAEPEDERLAAEADAVAEAIVSALEGLGTVQDVRVERPGGKKVVH